jgi:hypothetical protein
MSHSTKLLQHLLLYLMGTTCQDFLILISLLLSSPLLSSPLQLRLPIFPSMTGTDAVRQLLLAGELVVATATTRSCTWDIRPETICPSG